MSSNRASLSTDGGYLVYLFSVDENSLICGIDTTGGLDSEGNEVRSPCNFHNQEKLNIVLERMDRHAKQIDNWQQFYAWLGKGHGWAFFRCESAAKLAPHWLSNEFGIACSRLRTEEGEPMHGCPFVDNSLTATDLPSESQMLEAWEEITGDANAMGELHNIQMEDNMVITKQRLFVM